MTDNSDKEHIQPKPRHRDAWEGDWPTDQLRAFLSEDVPRWDEIKGLNCLPLLQYLGYDPEAIYRNLTYDVKEFTPTIEWFGEDVRSLEVDAAAAKFPELSPHLVINAHRCLDDDQDIAAYEGNRGQLISLDEDVACDYLRASGAKYSILLSNVYLIIARDEGAEWFDGVDSHVLAKSLIDIDWDFAEELKEILSQPEGLAVSTSSFKSQSTLREYAEGSETIETKYFQIDLEDYREAYRYVHEADTNSEKKESLESLSNLLFESITVTSVKETNFRGQSSEIDLIIKTTGGDGFTLFDEFGQYTLVECKNWSKPVGAKEIRDFGGKMEATGTQLGILFARQGVTGDKTDAERKIDDFSRQGRYIVVIDGRDLERISKGRSFYEIIEENLWRIRFNPYSSEKEFSDSL